MHLHASMQVYFMMQQESVEEQRLLELRIEREAFQSLILEKGRMVITEDRDALPPVPRLPGRLWGSLEATADGRQRDTCCAGGRAAASAANAKHPAALPTVIADVREFRSALFNMLTSTASTSSR